MDSVLEPAFHRAVHISARVSHYRVSLPASYPAQLGASHSGSREAEHPSDIRQSCQYMPHVVIYTYPPLSTTVLGS